MLAVLMRSLRMTSWPTMSSRSGSFGIWPVASGLTAAVTPTCSEAPNAGALRPATPRAASRIFLDVLFTFARLARHSVSRVFRSGAARGPLRGPQPRVIPHFSDVFKRPVDGFFQRANCPCRPIEAQKADRGESNKNVNGLIEKMLYEA